MVFSVVEKNGRQFLLRMKNEIHTKTIEVTGNDEKDKIVKEMYVFVQSTIQRDRQ